MPSDPPHTGTTDSTALDSSNTLQDELKTRALETMRKALKGNGIKTDRVGLSDYKEEPIEFVATTKLVPDVNISVTRKAGKLTTAKLVASANLFQDEANKEVTKITRSPDVINRIKDSIFQRDDKGLAIQNEYLKLPYLHRDFIAHEECQACRAQGKIACNACHGKGMISCPQCQGRGTITCPTCSGRQYITGPNGQNQVCQRCNGSGRISCPTCHEAREIQCRQCSGTGTMTCNQCNGHAWISAICHAEINMIGHYDYDKQNLSEKAIKAIDDLGSEIQDHSFIGIVDRPIEQEKQTVDIDILYHIKAPTADVEFEIEKGQGKEPLKIPAYMFGKLGALYDAPYFLENIMAPGIKSIHAAAAEQGDIAENLRKAGRYKTLRHILLAALKLPVDKAKAVVLKNNKIGISENTVETLLDEADKALKAITHKPRIIGAALGVLVASTLFALYFFMLRFAMLTAIKSHIFMNLMDFIILGAGAGLGVFTIQFVAGNALKKALSTIMKAGQNTPKTAKAGDIAYIAIALSILSFALIVWSTAQFGQHSPQWLTYLSD